VAQAAGVDLTSPPNPLLIHSYADGRLFYVFFKTVEGALGDRPWLIQRIRKTERTWATPDAEPEVKVTWQVEVFKTIAGALKRADRHYGSYALEDAARREVVKEYEIGFGEIPGTCEGKEWPFDSGILYKELQPYQETAGLYDQVTFASERRWSLTVEFDAQGRYRIASPAFGFDAPDKVPAEDQTRPEPDPASRDLVLVEGVGIGAFKLGESTPADLARLFGEPLEVVPVGRGHENRSVASSFTVNFDPTGVANTLITHTDFAGRTDKGIRLWDKRSKVMEVYGPPVDQKADSVHWRYDGVVFFFDGFERVSRIVLLRPS